MITAGWFSCKYNDRVFCTYCLVVCQNWSKDDDPYEIHQLLSPNCPFIQSQNQLLSKEIPIINEQISVATIVNSEIIKHSKLPFAKVIERVKSFHRWPNKQMTEQLVRAGFYYSGYGTIVTCFCCNISLTKMGPNHNSMIEHARYSPNCPYIKQLCGDQLFEQIQQLYSSNAIRTVIENQTNGTCSQTHQIVKQDDYYCLTKCNNLDVHVKIASYTLQNVPSQGEFVFTKIHVCPHF
ncbi:unnamed protein product [Didymodactylos carnosus]|uniref:Uncharacterized protein n=1 Tax=Didymodactylos carnosus TaxID=1234261 RepID=A0A8S2DRR9_9BILA|nr:unnamed protein product [Didymodactylos carnosus]CAF3752651.1 unnamed protein product [Didymodactylos carnosus]